MFSIGTVFVFTLFKYLCWLWNGQVDLSGLETKFKCFGFALSKQYVDWILHINYNVLLPFFTLLSMYDTLTMFCGLECLDYN